MEIIGNILGFLLGISIILSLIYGLILMLMFVFRKSSNGIHFDITIHYTTENKDSGSVKEQGKDNHACIGTGSKTDEDCNSI